MTTNTSQPFLSLLPNLIGLAVAAIETEAVGFDADGVLVNAIVLDDGTRLQLIGGEDGSAYLAEVQAPDGTITNLRKPRTFKNTDA